MRLARPVYRGDGLTVRELNAEELQRFLDVHARPARPSSWAAAGPPWTHRGTPSGFPRTPPASTRGGAGRAGHRQPRQPRPLRPGRVPAGGARSSWPAGPAAWPGGCRWSPPPASPARCSPARPACRGHGRAGRPGCGRVGRLAATASAPPSRPAPGSAAPTGSDTPPACFAASPATATWSSTTWPCPARQANVDHLVIGPSGVFVIDSKQWTGSVHQSADGLVWHNHYRLDRTLETVRWEAETIGRLLGTRAAALLCVHGAHVQGGGLDAQGVAIVPAQPAPQRAGPRPGAVGRRRDGCSPPPRGPACAQRPERAGAGQHRRLQDPHPLAQAT